MKKGIKRSISMAITFLLCFLFVFGMGGCTIIPEWKEEGDFIYRLERTKEGEVIAKLKGLSEAGKQKEILVIPEEIEGGKITKLTYGWSNAPLIESDAAKKIFVPDIAFNGSVFGGCKNLEKIIFYDNNTLKDAIISLGGGYISSYKYLSENYESNVYYGGWSKIYFANVSYIYNFDTTKNDGYYFIDDYDYGSKIEYIPKDPIRDGYTFGGWYRESECINKWDFETDTLPEEIIEDNLVKYQETKLYAKWETA